MTPRIFSWTQVASPGEIINLRGPSFIPSLGGGSRTNDDRAPVVTLRRLEDHTIHVLRASLIAADQVIALTPADLPFGHYALTITIRAAPSLAVPVRIAAPLGAACEKFWFCASGSCLGAVCAQPPVDAGVDAGVDGGLDAGGPDAGVDAGSEDAGADGGIDAGAPLPDAGLDDADSEPSDAGTAEPRQLVVGCGCSAIDLPLALLLLTFAARRRKLREGRRSAS